jgi:hypothetical protein
MPANVEPIYTLTPVITTIHLAAANTGADLSSNAALIFTGSTNGSLLTSVIIKYLPGTTTAATAARLWINNNGTLSTVANNCLITEITVAIVTTSQVAATVDYAFNLPRNGLFIPNTYRAYVTIGTYSAGTMICTGMGGHY